MLFLFLYSQSAHLDTLESASQQEHIIYCFEKAPRKFQKGQEPPCLSDIFPMKMWLLKCNPEGKCVVMGCVVSVYLDKRPPLVRLGVAPIPLLVDSATQVYTVLHSATQVHNTITVQTKGRHADCRYASICWSRAFIPLKSVLFKILYVASTMVYIIDSAHKKFI